MQHSVLYLSFSFSAGNRRLIVVIFIMTGNSSGNKCHIVVFLHNAVNKCKYLSVYNGILVGGVIVAAETEITETVCDVFAVIFFDTL